MSSLRKYILILLMFCSVCNLHAQSWQWCKHSNSTWGPYITSQPYGFGAHIATDQTGNIYEAVSGNITHISFPPYVFGGGTSTDNLCFLKYDSTGNILWAKNTTISNGDVHSVATDNFGNVYFAGHYGYSVSFGSITLNNPYLASVGHSGDLNYLVKYDGSGNARWAKTTGNCTIYNPVSIATDNSGNIFLTSTFDIDTLVVGAYTLVNNGTYPGAACIFTVKYDSIGNVVWAKTAGDKSYTTSTGIVCDNSGNAYVIGSFAQDSFNVGGYDLHPDSGNSFIIKYDAFGNVIWAKAKGGDYANNIKCDNSGNIYVSGVFSDDTTLFPPCMVFNHRTSTGFSTNIYLAKFDPSGNALWAVSAGGLDDSHSDPQSLSIDLFGNIWMHGAMDTTVFFDAVTLNAPPGSIYPSFLAAYDPAGSLIHVTAMKGGTCAGSSSTFWTSGLSADPFNNIYLASSYNCSAFTFDTTTISTGDMDFFVAKFNLASIPLKNADLDLSNGISLFPNPAKDVILIKSENQTSGEICLYNLMGQMVLKHSFINSNCVTLHAENLQSGIYICKISVGEKSVVKKIIIVH